MRTLKKMYAAAPPPLSLQVLHAGLQEKNEAGFIKKMRLIILLLKK